MTFRVFYRYTIEPPDSMLKRTGFDVAYVSSDTMQSAINRVLRSISSHLGVAGSDVLHLHQMDFVEVSSKPPVCEVFWA